MKTVGTLVFLPLAVAFIAASPVSGQTVVSTHAGVVYFFEGSVSLGGEKLEQRFGSFPDIGEGRELRTERGRAEVLLTPETLLRLDENSAIRLLSDKLADARVELLKGSAIVESTGARAGTSVHLIFKQWRAEIPNKGVYRIDSDPAQLRVYQGEAQVSAENSQEAVPVKEGEVLPFGAVLVAEQSRNNGSDAFKSWAMSRSQAVSADNAIAAEIVDAPPQSQLDSLNADADLSGFSYFPLTGVPSLGISNPYGLSFWSPYQSMWNSIYFPVYLYGPYYSGWPSGVPFYPRSVVITSPGVFGRRPGGIIGSRPGTVGLRPGTVGLRPGTVGLRPGTIGGPNPGVIGLRPTGLSPVGISSPRPGGLTPARPPMAPPASHPVHTGAPVGVHGGHR
jgi:FecR-like protein